MDGLPIESVMVVAGVVLLAGLLFRFGRALVRYALIAGGLLVAGLIAVGVVVQGAANYRTATAAVEASRAAWVGPLVTAACVGSLGTLALAVAGVVGWLYLRERLALRRPETYSGTVRLTGEPVVYFLDDIEGQAEDEEEVYGWAVGEWWS